MVSSCFFLFFDLHDFILFSPYVMISGHVDSFAKS